MIRRSRVVGPMLAIVVMLVGCVPSPTTTYVDASGSEVTVDWVDYPAPSWLSIDEVLAIPASEQVRAREHRMMSEISAVLADRFDLPALEAHSSGAWYGPEGNGYGGETFLRTYNSGEWRSVGTIEPAAWESVLAAIGPVVASYGLVRRADDAGAQWLEETGNWLRVADYAGNSTEWASVSVSDARRDAGALADATENDHLIAGVSIGYGISTIAEADREAFVTAAAPFAGLERPAPTESD